MWPPLCGDQPIRRAPLDGDARSARGFDDQRRDVVTSIDGEDVWVCPKRSR
jgi:hypothetical protein